MHDDRQLQPLGHLQLCFIEAKLLVAHRGFTQGGYEKIQADFANPYEAVVFQCRLEPFFQPVKVFFLSVGYRNGVYAQGVVSAGKAPRQLLHRVAIAPINGGNDDRGDPLATRPLDDGIPVGLKLRGIEMAMGVDQHVVSLQGCPQPQSRRSRVQVRAAAGRPAFGRFSMRRVQERLAAALVTAVSASVSASWPFSIYRRRCASAARAGSWVTMARAVPSCSFTLSSSSNMLSAV